VGKFLEEFGLDKVQKDTVTTTIPVPDPAHPATVAILTSPGKSAASSHLVTISKSYQGPTWIPAPHMAFSASGNVRGPVIYMNKGSFECFKALERRISSADEFRGAIGLARLTSHIEPGLIVSVAFPHHKKTFSFNIIIPLHVVLKKDKGPLLNEMQFRFVS
jgi:hypothetical protein